MTAPAASKWEAVPLLLPSDLLAAGVRHARESQLGFGPVCLGVFLLCVSLAYLAPLFALAVLIIGGRQAWLRHKAGTPVGGLSARKTGIVALAGGVGGLWLWQFGWFGGHRIVASVLSLVALEVLLARKAPSAMAQHPWSHNRLVAACLLAGALKRDKDAPPPKLTYIGKPETNARGTTVTIDLPDGAMWTDIAKHQHRIARNLKLPARYFQVDGGAKHDGIVSLWFGTQREPVMVPAEVTTAEVTDWTQPCRIGADLRGRPVYFQTVDTHTLFLAKTRAGKSWLARIPALHALKDPRVAVWMLNGKDKRGDWRAMAPACERYVAVDDAPSLDRAFEFLADLKALCDGRKDTDNPSPVVVFLEEWYSVRTLAFSLGSAKRRDELDAAAAQLGSVASGYGVHIIGLAQRGTDDYVAMGLKANMGSRYTGMVADDREFQYAMGFIPPGAKPSRKGEFFAQTDEDPATLFEADVVDQEAWEKGCADAIALRAPAAPAPLVLVKDTPAPPADLASAVRDILARADPSGVLAAEVFDRLPAELRPFDVASLGIQLTKFGWLTKKRTAAGVVYRFANPAQHPAHHLHKLVIPGPSTLHDAGSKAPSHAQNGTPMPPPALTKAMP